MKLTIQQMDQIQKSLSKMYKGYVNSKFSDNATRLERTQVAEDYHNSLQILADLRQK